MLRTPPGSAGGSRAASPRPAPAPDLGVRHRRGRGRPASRSRPAAPGPPSRPAAPGGPADARVPSRHARARNRVPGHGVARRRARASCGCPAVSRSSPRSTPTAGRTRRHLVPARGRRRSSSTAASAGAGRRTSGATRGSAWPSSDGPDWVSLGGTWRAVDEQADRPGRHRGDGPRATTTPDEAADGDRPVPAPAADQLPGRARARPRRDRRTDDGPGARSATRRCSSSSGRGGRRLLRRSPSSRLPGRHGRRPLPAVGPPAGPGGLRLERPDRHRRADDRRHRAGRHLPVLPDAPGDRGPGVGDAGRDVPRPALARPRLRRGAQRARRGRLLARDAGADRPDVRGDRDHPQAVHAARTSSTTASSSSSRRPGCGRCRPSRRRSSSRPPARSRPRRPACTPTG